MFRTFSFLLCCWTACLATTGQDINVLFLGDKRGHQPQTRFEILQPILAKKGIKLTYTEDVRELNQSSLDRYNGLLLYANIDEITSEQADALLNYVASGKGFIPIHCASYCFRNSPEVVALIGAQFRRHGKGEMTTQSADVRHPITAGYKSFTSWDETYVHHKHNVSNRVVLEYRVGGEQAKGNTREPWTWIRTHGKGRIFYTAWGHDERTWNQSSFQDLVQRGIRWACGEGETGMDIDDSQMVAVDKTMPPAKDLPSNLKTFDYIDVGPKIPNYAAGRGETLNLMQQPVPATESIRHMVTPEGLHAELFADESMLNGKMFGGKPIAMNWDEQGRVWICETVDYPNELHTVDTGRDRVRVIEDTDGDFIADKSTVFAEGLSIPTAIAFHRGGIVVQNGVETLYLKDTDGDGRSDVRKVLISNWSLGDTHGGVSNFRNGLDNWIWAMQGYNNSSPILNPESSNGGSQQQSFRMGFFRFKLSQDDDPIVEDLEFVRSTTNNTWGLGISEEGLIFGSTANRQPSFFMPIANRYYERVKGWAPETLRMICPTHLFEPITDKVRQVDHHGGYTAAAGHALYTARNYPPAYWNRTAFVCGPTGKLVGTFVIERDGAGMKSQSPTNLLASNDEWTAPIMAEVGPDGNVWVLDWYNYIVQHNPTPQGFETGKGNAYQTDLRDKKYGRIYRVVPDENQQGKGFRRVTLLTDQDHNEGQDNIRIKGLCSPTMLVRLNAQRVIVESGDESIVPKLIELIDDTSVDAIGLNAGAIHALNTLKGLRVLGKNGPATQAAVRALKHPSAGVRLNAIRVLPDTQWAVDAMTDAGVFADTDHQVVLATLLKLSDVGSANAIDALISVSSNPIVGRDRWLGDALSCAAAMHAETYLSEILASDILSLSVAQAAERASEHLTRSGLTTKSFAKLIEALVASDSGIGESVVLGMSRGWQAEHQIHLEPHQDELLAKLFQKSSSRAKGELARLASSLNSKSLARVIEPMLEKLFDVVGDDEASIERRLQAARDLIELAPNRSQTLESLCDFVGPQSPSGLATGLIDMINRTTAAGLGKRLIDFASGGTPRIRESAIKSLLARQDLTTQLLDAIASGKLNVSDLSAAQRSNLTNHPDLRIARRATTLIKRQGLTITSDRQKLVASRIPLTKKTGSIERGKLVFTKNCANCHVFKGQGNVVGPNLNGMSVHPKIELLTHILDPNRSVEANYRLYNVLTVDGIVISGLLSGETRTSIEMVDSQGKKHLILREDIDELMASSKSAMPEGFEQSIDDPGLVDLLEYLTEADDFIPLSLERDANVDTTEGMFTDRNNSRERLRLAEYGLQTIFKVPFQLIDPDGATASNAIMLHGPLGSFAPKMPKHVSIRCRIPAQKIHMLAGIAGWPGRGESMVVQLIYADGKTEDHSLEGGKHIADYINRHNVPRSKFAIPAQDGGQVRYLAIEPKRSEMIDSIELIKPNHQSAPLVLAITVERHHGAEGVHGR